MEDSHSHEVDSGKGEGHAPLLGDRDGAAEMQELRGASGSKFILAIKDMVELVEGYRQRDFDEDLKKIESAGGIEGVATGLGTSLEEGLSGGDFSQRAKAFGDNKKKPLERTGFWALFWLALDDLMLKILIVAAIVSMVISMIFEKEHRGTAWIEGAAILVAVFIVSVVTAWNDWKKEEQFIALSKFNDAKNNVTVWRRNQEEEVNVEKLHVGDLV